MFVRFLFFSGLIALVMCCMYKHSWWGESKCPIKWLVRCLSCDATPDIIIMQLVMMKTITSVALESNIIRKTLNHWKVCPVYVKKMTVQSNWKLILLPLLVRSWPNFYSATYFQFSSYFLLYVILSIPENVMYVYTY